MMYQVLKILKMKQKMYKIIIMNLKQILKKNLGNIYYYIYLYKKFSPLLFHKLLTLFNFLFSILYSNNDKLYDLSYTDDTVVDHPTIQNGHIAAIVAGSLAFLIVCLYVGLVLWRNMLK